MSILRFEAARFKKSPGAVSINEVQFQKIFGFSVFLAQDKNLQKLNEMLYDDWSLLGGFERAAKSMDKNLKKSTGILDY